MLLQPKSIGFAKWLCNAYKQRGRRKDIYNRQDGMPFENLSYLCA